ncbi:sigma-54-dependent Fis family transcriptional regulator [Tuberibacillus sp. Marseille-P3662]|uniref:sigma-54-dependent Fis family transcriptional regulator n=1 Tax=Tuberibacillus sp. Marseille-P3662 TaxID=1965358 RepID=UPI0020CB0B04|nr:sigma-54-dependent Fis family transcriptional regulator [Tuberibacillus sp. Marseille-P3662]
MAMELHQPIELNHTSARNQVKYWMTPPLDLKIGIDIYEAIQFMREQQCSEVIVTDEKRCVLGVLTTWRLFDLFLYGWPINETIQIDMLETVQSVFPDDAMLSLAHSTHTIIPVITNNQLVGQLSRQTILQAYSSFIQSKTHDTETLNAILESAYEGVSVSDENGYIQTMNKAYKNFLGVGDVDVIGKHVTDVIENTRMHIALETGIPERGYIQEIQGQKMVVHRIPIWRNGRISGCIGMLIFEGVSELYQIIERANEANRKHVKKQPPLERHVQKQKPVTFESIIGESHELANCKSMARRAARTMATVLITGDSGTGKELFARAIHHLSPWSDGQFISLNCAAIPEHLLEAELFGYEEGAFTGAKRGGKPGKFESADKGTIFLDEIGDMSLSMQAKILRVLQEKEVERVGGSRKIPVHVRVVAATNHHLEAMVDSGDFREDLYYRLNIIRLMVPSLKERKDDIPMLLSHHLQRFCEIYDFSAKTFTRNAMEALVQYDWPGNIREVVNMAEQLVTLVENTTIGVNNLPKNIVGSPSKQKQTVITTGQSLKSQQQEQEREAIRSVLTQANGNKTKAAELLGIHRSTLYQKLKRLQVECS